MNRHPFLRAYLAGICVPTIFLIFVATGYTLLRYVLNLEVPVERFIVFPMAVVPNAWGLWNVLFLAWHERLKVPLGLHGALLPIVLAPFGFVVAGILHFPIPAFVAHLLPYGVPAALIIYYLAWKYLVGFLNAELSVV